MTDATQRGVSDELFAAFADEQRRTALRALWEADGPLTLEALADRVAEDCPTNGATAAEHRRQVRLTLYHSHLPQLMAAGLVVTEDESYESDVGERGRALLTVAADGRE